MKGKWARMLAALSLVAGICTASVAVASPASASIQDCSYGKAHGQTTAQLGAITGPSGPNHFEGIIATIDLTNSWPVNCGVGLVGGYGGINNRNYLGIQIEDYNSTHGLAGGHYFFFGTGYAGADTDCEDGNGNVQTNYAPIVWSDNGTWHGMGNGTGLGACIGGVHSVGIQFNNSTGIWNMRVDNITKTTSPFASWVLPFDIQVIDGESYSHDSVMMGSPEHVTNIQQQAWSTDQWCYTDQTCGSAPANALNVKGRYPDEPACLTTSMPNERTVYMTDACAH